MKADVAELVRAGRLVEAGELLLAGGDGRAASALFEQACAWGRASDASLAAGDAGDALRLAALAGDPARAQAALVAVVGHAELVAVANRLRQAGHHAWSARAFERAGANGDAGEAWERAGDPMRAAELLERDAAYGPSAATRVLEAALRRDPDRTDVRAALGRLLLRCSKPEAALRVVQRVRPDAPDRRGALEVAHAALGRLGLRDAQAEVLAELTALGGVAQQDAPEPAPLAAEATDALHLYGRYLVVREISQTATARLVECTDTLTNERVALKIFSAVGHATRGAGRDALARFLREARVLLELAHPNVVPLRAVVEQGPALVLAWMPGGTLEERLLAEPFAPARAVDVARSVLQALGEAHRIGVVHRDIKPANILFDAAGTARLADFGVAHLGDLSVTATAGVFGSLAYMSPEQREGRPATAQSDLFGAGAVLLEMLTGSRPSLREAGREALSVGEPLASFHRHLGPEHDVVTRAFVARDPQDRPADAFAALRSLLALDWPRDVDPRRANAPRARPASVRPLEERIGVAGPGGETHDRWLDRPVMCVPLDEPTLARAALFARVPHRALQPLLRVDTAAGSLWLGVPSGAPLDRPLSDRERATLGEALHRLHAEGYVHGAIDRSAVVVGPHGPVLSFSASDGRGSVERDRGALAAL